MEPVPSLIGITPRFKKRAFALAITAHTVVINRNKLQIYDTHLKTLKTRCKLH